MEVSRLPAMITGPKPGSVHASVARAWAHLACASLMLGLLFGASWAWAEPACAGKQALDLAKQIYQKNADFSRADTPDGSRLFSAAFRAALDNHFKCQKVEGICHLDYDPWLGAQDGEIRTPIHFSVVRVSNNQATVDMRYSYYIADTVPVKPRRVQFQLVADAAPACWKLNDFITPLNESLLKAFSSKQP